jgi:CelD/BcsL family acetyltransferase involved in cellulose biosynthesis
MRHEIAKPSYSVDLGLLAASDGALDPVLSANARQQLRRALRNFEAHGPLQLREAASEAEAQSWFTGLKALHCASWERRGIGHSFRGRFFEKFHRRLMSAILPRVRFNSSRRGPAGGLSAISIIFTATVASMPIRAGSPTPTGASARGRYSCAGDPTRLPLGHASL